MSLKPLETPRLPRTAFLLRHVGIGDLVWHLPYIRGLARSSLNGQVSVIAPPSTLARDLLVHETCVDQVLDEQIHLRSCDASKLPRSGLRAVRYSAAQWRCHGFDRMVLFSDRYQHAMAAWLAGIPQRSGLGLRWKERLFLNQGPFARRSCGPGVPQHALARDFALAHGLIQEVMPPRLTLSAADREFGRQALAGLASPIVALCIGASTPEKQWGEAGYAGLAHQLLSAGVSVVLVGGPQEATLADRIRLQLPLRLQPGLRLFTDLQILRTAGVLAAADLCVGNDTGALNVAAAVELPCLCMLGPRPLLLHDPLIDCLAARRLRDITVAAVMLRVHGALAVLSLGSARVA